MNVLLIDDDTESLDSLSSGLKLNGFDVMAFEAPKKALHAFKPDSVDVVITDYHLPEMTAIDVITRIHKKKKETPVIVMSGDEETDVVTHALNAGAYAFFRKPLNINEIISIIKSIHSES